jgi:hypothetical protein
VALNLEVIALGISTSIPAPPRSVAKDPNVHLAAMPITDLTLHVHRSQSQFPPIGLRHLLLERGRRPNAPAV